MSRVAKQPIKLPQGVALNVNAALVNVKGPKGEMNHELPKGIQVDVADNVATISITAVAKNGTVDQTLVALSGTNRALISNMVHGVSEGFEKKLVLKGVGYRAQLQGKKLNLTLGLSHPVVYEAPEGITLETPSQTEISVKGADKQVVGQVAADIRSYRPPEPYKGKGIRYADEHISLKETKKK
ncbi:MAG: 50S ribosomal protein L6 [marine bacterium B5-7]|nr:MAG: 50S ribosomal protein L6 [marine bacterium B5-7]